MGNLEFSYNNIVEGNGIAIAITGMLIVFVALGFITIFISLLPKILKTVEPWLPPEGAGHGHSATAARPAAAAAGQQEEIVAAIGYVLHQRNQQS